MASFDSINHTTIDGNASLMYTHNNAMSRTHNLPETNCREITWTYTLFLTYVSMLMQSQT